MRTALACLLLCVPALMAPAEWTGPDKVRYIAFTEAETQELLGLMKAEHDARLAAESQLENAIQMIKKLQSTLCT